MLSTTNKKAQALQTLRNATEQLEEIASLEFALEGLTEAMMSESTYADLLGVKPEKKADYESRVQSNEKLHRELITSLKVEKARMKPLQISANKAVLFLEQPVPSAFNSTIPLRIYNFFQDCCQPNVKEVLEDYKTIANSVDKNKSVFSFELSHSTSPEEAYQDLLKEVKLLSKNNPPIYSAVLESLRTKQYHQALCEASAMASLELLTLMEPYSFVLDFQVNQGANSNLTALDELNRANADEELKSACESMLAQMNRNESVKPLPGVDDASTNRTQCRMM